MMNYVVVAAAFVCGYTLGCLSQGKIVVDKKKEEETVSIKAKDQKLKPAVGKFKMVLVVNSGLHSFSYCYN